MKITEALRECERLFPAQSACVQVQAWSHANNLGGDDARRYTVGYRIYLHPLGKGIDGKSFEECIGELAGAADAIARADISADIENLQEAPDA
jgi:hypothetical protein